MIKSLRFLAAAVAVITLSSAAFAVSFASCVPQAGAPHSGPGQTLKVSIPENQRIYTYFFPDGGKTVVHGPRNWQKAANMYAVDFLLASAAPGHYKPLTETVKEIFAGKLQGITIWASTLQGYTLTQDSGNSSDWPYACVVDDTSWYAIARIGDGKGINGTSLTGINPHTTNLKCAGTLSLQIGISESTNEFNAVDIEWGDTGAWWYHVANEPLPWSDPSDTFFTKGSDGRSALGDSFNHTTYDYDDWALGTHTQSELDWWITEQALEPAPDGSMQMLEEMAMPNAFVQQGPWVNHYEAFDDFVDTCASMGRNVAKFVGRHL